MREGPRMAALPLATTRARLVSDDARIDTPALSVSRRSILLAGAFLAFAVSASLMHAYTVFLVAFVETFHWSRADTSLAYSVSQLIVGIGSPLVGVMVDRLGQRRLVIIGGVLLVLGLLGTAQATTLWEIVVLYGVVMTLGANFLGLVVFVPLLSRVFADRRGMAISVVQSANGIARGISAPVAQLLIDGIGWRAAYLAQAAGMAALMPLLAAFFGRPVPASTPATPSTTTRVAATTRDWTPREAMRTPHFWLLTLVYVCTGLGSFLVSLHQVAFAVDNGFDHLHAAWVLGIGSVLAIPGTILTGTVSDKIGRELAAILAYWISILGVIAALFITGPEDEWLLWLHACLFGLTWGARGPAITAKTADLFGGRQLGTIIGIITIGSGAGAALGSWAAGWIFDMLGSYRLAFWLSIASYLGGCVAFWMVRKPPESGRYTP
jgi:MFS transporter, OFA family, oxalate/formate antiporter